MSFVFNLPDIGEGIAEAELISWSVSVGDRVDLDQPIAVVETAKAMVEMPAPAAGTVLRLGAEPGAVIRVGDLFISIDDGSGTNDEAGPPSAASDQQAALAQHAPDASGDTAPAAHTTSTSRPTASPASRRLARELRVALTSLVGSGPGGRIVDDDVRAAAGQARRSAATPTAASSSPRPVTATALSREEADERIPVRGIRRKTAEAMVRAVQEIPHTVSYYEAEFQAVLDLRRTLKARAESLGVTLTVTPFLVKAVALALVEHPMVNSSFDPGAMEIVVRARRNIGVAASTPDGLVIPVVKDADRKPLFAIAREVETLATASRLRQVALADLQEGTFTITNHGPLGGGYGTPIIRPPEAGIVGFGRAAEQAVVRDGTVVARTMLPISFSSDHRIVDGDLALGFCQTLCGFLENPLILLTEAG